MSDAQWVRENLPECASIAASFRAEFGDVRMTYASENGHVLGKESTEAVGVNGHDQARSKPCDGCRHLFLKLISPEGKHQQRACKLYRIAANRCADFAGRA